MAHNRLHAVRNFNRAIKVLQFSYLFRSSECYSTLAITDSKCWSNSSCFFNPQNALPWNNKFPQGFYQSIAYCPTNGSCGLPWTSRYPDEHQLMKAAKLPNFSCMRSVTTQAKAPPQVRQMGALKVSMLSPGIVYEPYAPREPMSFWKRWFTRNGWKRTKEDIILELKSAYAISKLRKYGYSKKKFYNEAIDLYKEINTLMANGDKGLLRKTVTENMYSALKNEIKQRGTVWSHVYWELVEPVVKMRTLRARLIGVDRNDLSKVFIQLTLEFLTKQKFEAYDSNGAVVAGDKNKEVLVRDIWVFEKSLFHPGAYWRLCARIKL
ncbi:Mitochondrial inner membrane translocase complex [Abeliophyllum distichum]|uniref:Large ribosomal subunit protein mL45 n=1 Tax=Abeliophyllum distichum TaxID=126358 RepID=A0ABD1NWQ3_9LAMI